MTNLNKCLILNLYKVISFNYNSKYGDQVMKTKRTILKTLAITAITFLASGSALAHSDHDHSVVPFKWEFSKKLNAKVERDLNSNKPTGTIGLNSIEQKKFDHYGIKVGNKFNSSIRNVEVTFERVSSGLKITDASLIKFASTEDIVPKRNISSINKVSGQLLSHVGHDHNRLPVEWVFGPATNSKIVKHMFEGKGDLFVGLTRFEQKLLNEYDIRTGNQFNLSISGHSFLAERTSGGLNIINHVENDGVAKVKENTTKDNV